MVFDDISTNFKLSEKPQNKKIFTIYLRLALIPDI